MSTGYLLSELRREKRLSQEELAKIIGTSQSSVGHWESGRRNIPQDKLLQLSKYFNVSIDYLLGISNSRKKYYDLSRDNIVNRLEKIMEEIESGIYTKDLDKFDEDSKNILINSLSLALSIAKKEEKRKKS